MYVSSSFSIAQMQEAGFIDKWKKEWWRTSEQCSKIGPSSSAQSLKLSAMSGIFILMGTMSILTLIVLAIEYLIFNRIRK